MTVDTPAVDLTNCDREPIHVPGAIQPHGALLAFNQSGRLITHSANAADSFGALPSVGALLTQEHLQPVLRQAIAEALTNTQRTEPFELTTARGLADVVLHRSEGLLVVELEFRPAEAPPAADFAIKAQRALARIQGDHSLDQMLQAAAEEIRLLTGFDRVMTYRFQHDDSGLVVGESKRDDLEPFLGLRYPASDIPVQARRLYTLNPLRLIADINDTPVALSPTVKPLDLSLSILRSVSPIHLEYLRNMGVNASMSISIVIQGKLWGLFACHHMTPKRVSYAVRIASNLLSQVVAALVERAQTASESDALSRSLATQVLMLERALTSNGLTHSLTQEPGARQLLDCIGVAVSMNGELSLVGQTPTAEGIDALIHILSTMESDVFETRRLTAEFPDLASKLGAARGLLSIRFYREQRAYVMWFRGEEVETVRWAGAPEKKYDVGPNGPRLSPRGSFAEWREQVTGQSRPFSDSEIAVATRLLRALQGLALARARSRIEALEFNNQELDRLAYVTSHDLKAPLRAIASLSEFIEEDLQPVMTDDARKKMKLLRTRVVRLDDLLHGILNYSRAGRTRRVRERVALNAVVDDTLTMLGVPAGVEMVVSPSLPVLTGDKTALRQIFINLLSNAFKHGVVSGKGRVEVGSLDRGVNYEVWVKDSGPGIPQVQHGRVFEIFARLNETNDGTGIGLAVVRRLVESEGGRVSIESAEGQGATFRIMWPKLELS